MSEVFANEPSEDKSLIEYTTEAGENLKEVLGDLSVFLDRALATSKISPYEKRRLAWKVSLAMDYMRAGLVNEAKIMLTEVCSVLQLSKSENGFYLVNMKTQRQESVSVKSVEGMNKAKGFLSWLWRGGKKE